jgi:HEPN domain-containing protein
MADARCTPDDWVKLSNTDLDMAGVALTSGHGSYVLFHCQQALEKRLKALASLATGEYPPRLHSLRRLAAHCRLAVPEHYLELFDDLVVAYTASRYDAAFAEVAEDPGRAAVVLGLTQEAARWLDAEMERLKSEQPE